MSLYDFYAAYRKPLTESEKALIEEAGKQPKVAGEVDPVCAKHMEIAMMRAEQQFKDWPPMPEEANISERFPGVDPKGRYSIIDMKVAQRLAQINATLESRSPAVQEYARSLLDLVDTNAAGKQLDSKLMVLSVRHRTLTRAAKLCHDPAGQTLLHQKSRALEQDQTVAQYDLFLQGVEYAAGVRTGPVPQEVQDFYKNTFNKTLDLDLIKQAEIPDHAPHEISVEFQNMENKLQQTVFANPQHWGKSPNEATVDGLSPVDVSGAIPPYARATANRVIDPLFSALENRDATFDLNRGDYIIIDGKTVRERMYEDYVASEQDPETFKTFYTANVQKMAGEYVAGALAAGKRVEMFVPDKDGNIQNEPFHVTKKGYEPSAMTPVVMNSWEKFWSKFGFYKEKTKAADEYQRAMDARERVKLRNLHTKMELHSVFHPKTKAIFFADELERNGKLPTELPNDYSVTRGALTTTAVCAMVKAGYSVEDIYDHNKLLNEKREFGKEVLSRMRAGDQRWMGETLFHGQRLLADYMDNAARTINVLDEKVLFQDENSPLFFAAKTAFDASQECSHCKQEYKDAANRFDPINGEAIWREVDNRVNTVSMYFDFGKMALESANDFASGVVHPEGVETNLQAMLRYEATHKMYAEKMAASPNTPMSEQFTIDTMGPFYNYSPSVLDKPGYEKLAQAMENTAVQQEIGKSWLKGDLREQMEITVSPDMKKNDFNLNGLDKIIEKQVPQNNAPQMGRAK